MLTNQRALGLSPSGRDAITVALAIVILHIIMKVGEIDVFLLTWVVEKAASLVLVGGVFILAVFGCRSYRRNAGGDPQCWRHLGKKAIGHAVDGLNFLADLGDKIAEERSAIADLDKGDK